MKSSIALPFTSAALLDTDFNPLSISPTSSFAAALSPLPFSASLSEILECNKKTCSKKRWESVLSV